MASSLKHEVCSTILKWKLSINCQDNKDETFVNGVFKELDSLMPAVFDKQEVLVRNKDCHKILDIWPMTERTIERIHSSIVRRLHAIPLSSLPFYGHFSRDVVKEVFEVILKHILERTNWGIIKSASSAQVTVKITEWRKGVYLFTQMNNEGVIVEKENLLRKEFTDKSHTEVIISEENPLTLKYNYNREVLLVTFHYGCWNSHGIPQH